MASEPAVKDLIADPELAAAAWDLEPLVEGEGRPGVDRRLDEATRRAQEFASRHAGQVAALDGPGLREAMQELADIHDLVGRAGSYANLDHATSTVDPERGALLQRVQERGTEIETKLLFFELEWAALDDERAEELLQTEGLDFCRHYLRSARRYRPYLLSEPEEKILAEKALSGRSAWNRLFAEETATLEVELDGKHVPLEAALSRLLLPDRDMRRAAAEGVTAALEPGLRTRAFVFNTLLADKATDDRLRSYPNWLRSRNLANEVSDESVQALIDAVQARHDIPRRWYRLKAQLLGLEKLADYDRSAPVTSDEETVAWREARELVLDSYGSFSGTLGDVAREFFTGRFIDAPLRPGKRGGAFCATAVPSVHPYVMLNYTATRRDVLVLAHELGHGVHYALARPQGIFHQHGSLTMAETASVFGETIVFGRLLDQAPNAESRLALLAENVEGSIATVFRQVAMNRFEDAIHTARREEGELSVDRFGELWAQTQSAMFGDTVEITPGYRSWWSYVHHFLAVPGYVYAYAFGQLLALSVYDRYVQSGPDFVPAYLEMLSLGGSRPPEELGKIVGIDLTDPGFWNAGLDLVERQLEAAERAAADSRR